MFIEEKEKLKNHIKTALKISNICITADSWLDDINKVNYLGMNVHFLHSTDKNKLILVSRVMALRAFDAEEQKTADNITRAVMAVINEYELHPNIDSIVFVTDRAPNMTASLPGCIRFNCINHMCNNIVTHAVEHATNVISQVSRVVKYIKVTGLNTKMSKRLVSYASTRWNTIYDMLDSFISLHEEISDKIKNSDIIGKFENIRYDTVVAVRDYLAPYKYVSKETEGDMDVTCVKILPLVETLLNNNIPKPGDASIVCKMKTTAKNYIKDHIIPDLPVDYRQWAFFHPAWKRMDCFKTVTGSVIFDQIKDSLNNIQIQVETENVQQNNVEPCSSIFANLQDNCFASSSIVQTDADAEIENYINLVVPNALNINVLDFWEANQMRFPRLYKKFIKIAPIVASSASVERMFSTTGQILTARRNRLSTVHVEQLLFLNRNLK